MRHYDDSGPPAARPAQAGAKRPISSFFAPVPMSTDPVSALGADAAAVTFAFLSVEQRLRCNEVCCTWREWLRDPSLWRHLDLSGARPSEALLRAALRAAGSRVTYLDLSGWPKELFVSAFAGGSWPLVSVRTRCLPLSSAEAHELASRVRELFCDVTALESDVNLPANARVDRLFVQMVDGAGASALIQTLPPRAVHVSLTRDMDVSAILPALTGIRHVMLTGATLTQAAATALASHALETLGLDDCELLCDPAPLFTQLCAHGSLRVVSFGFDDEDEQLRTAAALHGTRAVRITSIDFSGAITAALLLHRDVEVLCVRSGVGDAAASASALAASSVMELDLELFGGENGPSMNGEPVLPWVPFVCLLEAAAASPRLKRLSLHCGDLGWIEDDIPGFCAVTGSLARLLRADVLDELRLEHVPIDELGKIVVLDALAHARRLTHVSFSWSLTLESLLAVVDSIRNLSVLREVRFTWLELPLRHYAPHGLHTTTWTPAARSLGPPISDDFGQAHPAVAAAAARALAAEPRVAFGAACSECISFW